MIPRVSTLDNDTALPGHQESKMMITVGGSNHHRPHHKMGTFLSNPKILALVLYVYEVDT